MSDVPQAGHGVLSCLLLPEVFYFFLLFAPFKNKNIQLFNIILSLAANDPSLLGFE
jgi:hypothetical protein